MFCKCNVPAMQFSNVTYISIYCLQALQVKPFGSFKSCFVIQGVLLLSPPPPLTQSRQTRIGTCSYGNLKFFFDIFGVPPLIPKYGDDGVKSITLNKP